MLLFLDFDGVLHPRAGGEPFNDECMTALARAIELYPVEIVIASTWREEFSVDKLCKKLSKLKRPVVGTTPIINEPFMKYVRYYEVQEYLLKNNQHSQCWLAIDDTRGFYPTDAPVYWTDPERGFCETDIEKLQDMMNNLMKKMH